MSIRKYTKETCQELLFEKNIKEIFQPDSPKDIDRINAELFKGVPDPERDAAALQQLNDEISDELPLTSSDVMSNPSVISKLNLSSIMNKEYCPVNQTEFLAAINTLFKSAELNDKEITVLWRKLRTYLKDRIN